MLEGKVWKMISLLILVLLFMSACSQTQPQVVNKVVKKKDKVTIITPTVSKTKKQKISLTKLSLNSQKPLIQEENWVPLKVEDEIEWNAKELLGHKYVWGATGPMTYDCSGFTRKIFSDVGIHLPRVSREQAKQGQLISFYELKKGDLVFFATKKGHPNRVTHVGIYLGDGNFIHASSSAKKVVICNFEKQCFYKKHFLWARRVISEKQHVATTTINSSKKISKSL